MPTPRPTSAKLKASDDDDEPPDYRAYVHNRCNGVTTVSGDDYLGLCDPMTGLLPVSTFCTTCNAQAPVGEFAWTDTGESIADYRKRMLATIPLAARVNARLIRFALILGFPTAAFLIARAFTAPGAVVVPTLALIAGLLLGVLASGMHMIATQRDFRANR